MLRSSLPALLVAWTTFLASPAATAADVARYFQSSASSQPRGDAGWVVSGTRMRLAADLSLRAPNGDTEIRPKVTSMFTLGERVGLETRVHLPDWNDGGMHVGTNLDTRLRVRAPAPFLDELEGRIWKSHDGQTGRVLKLGFYQRLRDTNPKAALTIRGRATLESASPSPVGNTADVRRLGLETEIGGFMPGTAAASSTLRMRVSKSLGAARATTRTLAYDRAWRFQKVAEVGMNFGVQRATQQTVTTNEPSIGFRWHAQF